MTRCAITGLVVSSVLLVVGAIGSTGTAVLLGVLLLVLAALLVAVVTDDPDEQMMHALREDVRRNLWRQPSGSVTKSMSISTAPTSGGNRSA